MYVRGVTGPSPPERAHTPACAPRPAPPDNNGTLKFEPPGFETEREAAIILSGSWCMISFTLGNLRVSCRGGPAFPGNSLLRPISFPVPTTEFATQAFDLHDHLSQELRTFRGYFPENREASMGAHRRSRRDWPDARQEQQQRQRNSKTHRNRK